MDVAMTDTGPITIEILRTLDMVPEMWCPGETAQGDPCEGIAWSASMDSTVQSAHFRANHITGCLEHPSNTGSRAGDQGHAHQVASHGSIWKIRLSAAEKPAIPNGTRQRPDPQKPGQRTRILTPTDQISPSRHPESSLYWLLTNLVAGTCPPDLQLQLAHKEPTPLAQTVIHIEETQKDHWNGQRNIVWGKIRGHKTTPYNGSMLIMENAGDRLAVLLPQKTLEAMKETEPEKLVGRHAIAYGQFPNPPFSRNPYFKVEAKHQIEFMPRRRRHKTTS